MDGSFYSKYSLALDQISLSHLLALPTQVLYLAQHSLANRDLARTLPACFVDRPFHEKLLFGQANISMKNFQIFKDVLRNI